MRFVGIALLVSVCAVAQERINVPFSDPNRPKTVKVNLIEGTMTVRTHAGRDVIVESGGGGQREEVRNGLRRLTMHPGLNIEEENNVVEIKGTGVSRSNITILVPSQTTLNLKGVNSCRIDVQGVDGDIDANCVNGSIELTNVSGSVVAHSVNGAVRASLDRVNPQKPMAFSTLNGDVEVTLPAATKADLRMKTTNGDVYTDFEVTIGPTPSGSIERSREGGKYRVRIDRGIQGTINGGGQLITLNSLNGRIYLRKK